MEPYQNTSGQSGIDAFELGADWIRVRFTNGWLYTFTEPKIGKEALTELQSRAVNGQGLNTYINQHVREQYTNKKRWSRQRTVGKKKKQS